MKTVRLTLLAIACSVPLLASAQWHWVDKDGRKVFSDQAPPADIAPNRILKGPKGRKLEAQDAAAVAVPTSASPAADLPKPTGKDPALEQKRKQAEAAEAAKKKAEEEKMAALQAENCTRAKASKAGLDSGVRIARTNAKGEKEYLDDNQRASELRLAEQLIARDCRK
jgi:hypothetical protein